jgi:Bacterial Ig-like domain/Concanavalin A-like lectin/glucanases superfamily
MIMKKVKWIVSGLAAITLMVATLAGCGEDDGPAALKLVSLKTDAGVDLNGVTSATGIPVGATIVAEFSTDVDDATIEAIEIIRDYDEASEAVNITVDGKTVTINPNANLGSGTLYIVTFGAGLASSGGKSLSAAIERGMTTAGDFVPTGVIAHFTFENSVADVVGAFDPTNSGTDVTYVDSRKTGAGKAASFNGTTTIIEVPNGNQLMANGDFALSFWVKVDGTRESHFVMGLGGWYGFQFEILGGAWTATDKGVKLATRYQLAASTDAEDTWWNGNPNGWQGSLFSKDVSGSGGIAPYFKDVWAHVVCTYNKTSKVGTMYVNGQKARAWDFDLWPDADAKRGATGVAFAGNTTGGGNNFAIGFIQASGNRIIADSWADPSVTTNNHFKGLLDDIRIYDTAISEAAILLMYNSEKP